nr:RNA-directed DNA polymerase, eukaryota [Tanacetum cinerariifolium]
MPEEVAASDAEGSLTSSLGIKIDSSFTISHLFYADDAVFIDEWSNANLTGTFSTEFKVTKGRLRGSNGLKGSVALSLRRTVRGGVEAHQLDLLQNLIGPTILTNLEDRWVWGLNGEGVFRVKDVRNLLDES